jgi:hypothetical protein
MKKKIVTGVLLGSIVFSSLALNACGKTEKVVVDLPNDAVVADVVDAISEDTLLDEHLKAMDNKNLKYSYDELVSRYADIKNKTNHSAEGLTASLNSYIFEMGKILIPAAVATSLGIDPELIDYENTEVYSVNKDLDNSGDVKQGIVKITYFVKPEGYDNYDLDVSSWESKTVEYEIAMDLSDLDKAFVNTMKAKAGALTVAECDLAQLRLCKVALSHIETTRHNQLSSTLDPTLVDSYNRSLV